MLRTALKPRWAGLLALAVVLAVVFWRLGLWQLHVAQSSDEVSAPSGSPVAVATVLRPHGPFPDDASGRLVTTTGTYAADGQILVWDRRLDSRSGFWVVTPLVDQSNGATLAVVRGFATSVAEVVPAPKGTVTVTGSLAPGESPSTDSNLPKGVLGSVDLSVLVNRWSGDLYNAFVFATAESTSGGGPMSAGALQRVPPPVVGGGGLHWRNAAYALQWWLFAGFAFWMWAKMVRDDWVSTRAAQAGDDDLVDEPKEHSDTAA